MACDIPRFLKIPVKDRATAVLAEREFRPIVWTGDVAVE